MIVPSPAFDGIMFDGMVVMTGGFALCGIPQNLIMGLKEVWY